MQSNIKLFQLSFTGRAECLQDINVFVSDALSNAAIYRFIYSYSASHTELYDGKITMVFQCPEQSRTGMKQAVALLLKKLTVRAQTEDLHVLRETLHFSEDYTGERTNDTLTERLMSRLDKMMG
jgi:hypothetical protein